MEEWYMDKDITKSNDGVMDFECETNIFLCF